MRREWTVEEETLAADMGASGLSSYQIADRLGRPRGSVTAALARRGVRLPRKGGVDPAIIAAIRELAAPGDLSASKIGDRLRLTRNQVIGLARRHGIKLRAPLPSRAGPRKSRARPSLPAPVLLTSAAAAPPTHDGSAGKVSDRLGDTPAAMPAAAPVQTGGDQGKSETAVTFISRRFWQCAWIDDDAVPIQERLCCGARTMPGKSYCPDHWLRSLAPVQPKPLKRLPGARGTGRPNLRLPEARI